MSVKLVPVCAVVCAGVLLTLGCDRGGGHRTASRPVGTGSAMSAASPLTFAGPTTYPTGVEPQSVAVGDLNRDGKPDLVTPNSRAGTVSVLINRGHGAFEPARAYRAGHEPRSVAVGDLNGDGKLDVVTANGDANSVSVLLNRGGSLRPKTDYRVGSFSDPTSVGLGDLNGDGKLDVVTANFADGTVSALLNRGDGRLEPKIVYRTETSLVAVAVADLDGDGRADLVLTPANKVVIVLLNKGDGTFPHKADYETGADPVVAIGDLNDDRKPDLAIATDESTVSVLINEGDGSFRADRDYVTGTSRRSETMCERCVAFGDLNGDGRPDLVTANQGADTVSVLLNKGDAGFWPRRDHRVGTQPRSIAIGDLNGDGKLDLVGATAGNMVSVLANTAGAPTEPARRPAAAPQGSVVFASNRSGNFEIYSAHADGSQLGQLTRGRLQARRPLASPDGRRLIFGRAEGQHAFQSADLWVVSADGSGERKLASYVYDPVWAPDSSRIAYTDPDGRLVISSVDGSRRVIFHGASHWPSWSPDGRRLVFERGFDRRDVVVVGDDGRGLTTIRRGIGIGAPAWSPTGDLIAIPARDGGLVVVTPEGRGVRRLAWKADTFAWSPDGRRVAFVAGGRLYVVPATRGMARDVTPASAGRLDAPAWSPDGRWLAVASRPAAAIFHDLLVVAADGSSSRRITTGIPRPYGSENLWPSWWPRGTTGGRLGEAPVAPLPSEVVSASAYDTAGSIEGMAADGARAIVVFDSRTAPCSSVVVWEPMRRRVVRLQHPCAPEEDEGGREGTGGAVLAGTRAAWVRISGGNTLEQYVYTATLARPTPVEIAEGYLEEGGYGDVIRNPVGSGNMLVFTGEQLCETGTGNEGQCPPGRKSGDAVAATVWRIGEGRRSRVAHAKGKLSVLAVDAGRIAVRTDDGVRLLNADGDIIREFGVSARQAALSGKRLAVRTANALEIYDVDSGRVVTSFPVTRHLRLEDLEGDILVTASARTVTLRSLGNGRATAIHTVGIARAQLEPPGLFVSGGRRVTFTPMRDILRLLEAKRQGR